MARLAIYNGNTLVREVDLSEGTLRVGRSDQNDIVLIDPAKAVSRFHAELRVQGTACTIVDLNSQNGIWVAGRRVPQVSLTPGQAVLLGTYRLVLEAGKREQEAAERTTVQPTAPKEGAASQRQWAPAPAPEEAPAPPHLPQSPPVAAVLPPLDAVAPPAPRPEAAHGEAPSQLPAVPKATTHRPVPVQQGGRGRRALLLAAASVCLALAGVAGGVLWWPSSSGPRAVPVQAPAESPQPQGVLGGPPTEAPPAPVPANGAGTSVQGVPPAAVSVPAGRLDAAAPTTTRVPEGSARAEVVASARGPATAKPKKAVAPPARRESAPSSKGAVEPKAREVNPTQLVEQARSAVGKGDYVTALALLEPVMRVDAGNPDALDLLASVRSQGHDAFKRGRQFDALGRTPEAIAMYERAVKLLPPDHPSVQAAKERLAALR